MNSQKEYLEALEDELRYLKPKEINEIVKHYRDKINSGLDYGETEEKVIQNLPDPKDVAKNLYESRGISYLEIQKQRYHRKQIFKAIYSGILIFVLLFVFIGIIIYLGLSTYNMNVLIGKAFSFTSLLDIILTTTFVLLYDLLILIVLLYIFDLFYIFITYFTINILDVSPKTHKPHYRFQDFSITGTLEAKTKIKKFPLVVISGIAILMLISSIVSFSTKGYIFRALMDAPLNKEIIEYDNKIKNITIKGDSANVYLVVDHSLEKVNIEYRYEFANSIRENEKEYTIDINKVSIKSFDIFKILDEPTPVIYIKLPSNEYLQMINIEVDEGIVSYKNLNAIALTSDVKLYNGTVLLENVSMKNLSIDGFKLDVKIANTDEEKDYHWINETSITQDMGTIGIEGYRFNQLNVENAKANIQMNKLLVDQYKLNNSAGNIVLNDIKGDNLEFHSSTSVNYIYDINFKNAQFDLFATCSLTAIRTIVSEELQVKLANNSYLNMDYLKTPLANINNNMGTLIIYDVNKNHSISDSDDKQLNDLKSYYNNQANFDSTINIESNSDVKIDNSIIDELLIKQNKKQIELSNLTLSSLNIEATQTKSIELSEVYGENVYFVLNNSPIKYYNNEDTIPFKVKFTGVSQIYTNKEYVVE